MNIRSVNESEAVQLFPTKSELSCVTHADSIPFSSRFERVTKVGGGGGLR